MQKNINDQSFDGIADKFERNIYGTNKGRLRHDILCHILQQALGNEGPPLRILDLGGGTGVMAKTLTEWGHRVDLVDVSDEALSLAKTKLEDVCQAGKVRFFCSSLQTFEADERYDLVICHAVLEWLANPLTELEHIVRWVKPGGKLSLSFFNQHAKLFSNITYGNFDYVKKGMVVKNQVRLNPQTPLILEDVEKELNVLGYINKQISGIRCFHDYMKSPLNSEEGYQSLLALEKQYCQTPPFNLLARYIHVLAH